MQQDLSDVTVEKPVTFPDYQNTSEHYDASVNKYNI